MARSKVVDRLVTGCADWLAALARYQPEDNYIED